MNIPDWIGKQNVYLKLVYLASGLLASSLFNQGIYIEFFFIIFLYGWVGYLLNVRHYENNSNNPRHTHSRVELVASVILLMLILSLFIFHTFIT